MHPLHPVLSLLNNHPSSSRSSSSLMLPGIAHTLALSVVATPSLQPVRRALTNLSSFSLSSLLPFSSSSSYTTISHYLAVGYSAERISHRTQPTVELISLDERKIYRISLQPIRKTTGSSFYSREGGRKVSRAPRSRNGLPRRSQSALPPLSFFTPDCYPPRSVRTLGIPRIGRQ